VLAYDGHLGDQIPFVSSGRLDDGEARSCRRQEREKLRTAFGRVLKLTWRARRQNKDLQALLGDIDSHEHVP
jgi:hypothetical protein